MKRFENKVAIVTGGASGMGEAFCRLFVKEGGRVAIVDLNESRGADLVAELGTEQAAFIKCDVSDNAEVKAMVDAAVNAFGQLDVVFNNAGIAASNGVECAKLAALGLSSTDDGLIDPQGFIPTHTIRDDRNPPEPISSGKKFLFEGNKYKFHACCHGTHAMIEGLQGAGYFGVGLDKVSALTLRTNPRWLKVCDNKSPDTGLEVTFSYVWLAGMTIRGDDTSSEQTFTDSLASDTELSDFAERVEVIGDPDKTDLQAEGEIMFVGGQKVSYCHDLGAELSNELLGEKISKKAISAIGEKGLFIRERLFKLDELEAADIGSFLAAESN